MTNRRSPNSSAGWSGGAPGQLLQFLAQFFQDGLFIGPGEAAPGGAPRQGLRPRQRRQRQRHALEGGGVGVPLGGLEPVPVRHHRRRSLHHRPAKDVRVAADQLGADALAHLPDVEAARVLGDLSVQDDLHHEIAQFLAQPGGVAAVERRQHFVALFQQVRPQRSMILLQVPGTALLGVAQPRDHADEAANIMADLLQRNRGQRDRLDVVRRLRGRDLGQRDPARGDCARLPLSAQERDLDLLRVVAKRGRGEGDAGHGQNDRGARGVQGVGVGGGAHLDAGRDLEAGGRDEGVKRDRAGSVRQSRLPAPFVQ